MEGSGDKFMKKLAAWDNRMHMYVALASNTRQSCRLAFVFGVALIPILFASPGFAAVNFDAPPPPPPPSPDIYATHAGSTLVNESPRTESFVTPTVLGKDLIALDTL